MSLSIGSLESLKLFRLDRILNEDPISRSLTVLGSFPIAAAVLGEREQAILKIEKTPLNLDVLNEGVLGDVRIIQTTDIYTWLFGWISKSKDIRVSEEGIGADVKINIICPATEVHIRKYTTQRMIMVQETPSIYERVVRPFIDSFPPSRTQWVDDILTGKSEQDKVLFSCPEFLILPDMKWDLVTVSTLYLVAIARYRPVEDRDGISTRTRSMRDLRRADIPWLNKIRHEAGRIVQEKWQLPLGSLRCFIHYQPSYYQFHVHIVNAGYTGLGTGMIVGQAWLLDDVISLLELDNDSGPGIMQRMTFTYGLGEQHGLFQDLRINSSLANDTNL
ncbi:scavenger mRNA decapping enzyme [Athelia psychrophila]|uniref:Scavenger mRNA decapping enzyme n=1 Tax=Athelia psychrophila TaxID=1759441 RepID=A0A166RDV5_9AGAM|nr:scavenger mRNA decapping enzyme [Fibularhizoctonia sp. CBS 109695]KZP28170.1 scavenger mRNA decapping enzyme [Fibularhizoctonia sp. CBS 109695]